MSRVLALLALCTLLAIVRATLIGLAVVAVLMLLFAFVRRPKETLSFLGVLTLSGVAMAQPTVFIVGATIAVITIVLAGRWTREKR